MNFTTGSVAITQFLYALNYWIQHLDSNYPIDVLYLEFKKTLDLVSDKHFLNKLHGFSIQGIIIRIAID